MEQLDAEARRLSQELKAEEETQGRFNDEMRAMMDDAVADSLETRRFVDSLRSALAASRPQVGAGAGAGAGGGVGVAAAEQPPPPLLTHPPLFIADMGSLDDVSAISVSSADAAPLRV